MVLKVHPENPGKKQIDKITETLKNGGIIIYPTDTVYAFACSVEQAKAADKIVQIKGEKKRKSDFSLIFRDISQITDFTRPIPNDVFKLMKNSLPGPFTFLLEANNRVPKIYKDKKKIIGARIPNNNIAISIVEALGVPLMTSSVHDPDEILEYTTDPKLIEERYGKQVDIIVDGGTGDNEASTVIDCTGEEIEIVRQGKGEL